MQYTLVSSGDESNITVFIPGELPLVAHSDHPNFGQIVSRLTAGDGSADEVRDLFDISVAAGRKLTPLSRRVSAANGRIFFDGDEVNNALTGQIVRFLNEGVEDWKPLVKFFEKVMANPNGHSRTQLFDWLLRHDFTLTTEGDIVGYKGVQVRDGEFVSITAGPAIVDGEQVNGNVPNYIGAVVEMPRTNVQHDPSVGCSVGLHVGTYEYARGFSRGAVLEVHVNPTDVVSVPTDCNWQKVRTSRYVVVDTIDVPYTAAVLDSDGSHDEDEFYGGPEDDSDWS